MDSTEKVASQKSQHRSVKKNRFRIEDLIGQHECEGHNELEVAEAKKWIRDRKAMQLNQDMITEGLAKTQEDGTVKSDEIPKKMRKRKRVDFICVEEFNHLACQQPIPWTNLPRDYICYSQSPKSVRSRSD